MELTALPTPALVLRDGGVAATNTAGATVFGGTAADPLGPLDPDDRHALLEAARSPAPEATTVVVRTPGPGPRRSFDVALGPLPRGGAVAVVSETTETRRLDAALCEVATGIYTTDAELRGLWMPSRVAEVLGIDPRDFAGIDVHDLVHPDDHGLADALVTRAVSTPGVKFAGTMRILHPHMAGVYWPIVAYVTWLPHDPAIAGLLVRFDAGLAADLHHDPAEHPTAGMVTLGDASPIGFLNLALDGSLVQRSTRVQEILRPVGIDDGGAAWEQKVRPADRPIVAELLAAGRAGEVRAPVEVGFEGEGRAVWCRLDVLPYRDHDGTVVGTFVNFLDVTTEHEAAAALAAAREELWQLANHDPLTGVWNRVPFTERLATAVRTDPARGGSEARVGLLVCDLDGFKGVNDVHGHTVGDEVLVVAARRLADAVRDGDVVCRFGGDEFMVLCERIGADDLVAVAERIVDALAAPVTIDGLVVQIGVSVGAALAEPSDADDPDALVRRADRAMYQAKGAGRGRVVLV